MNLTRQEIELVCEALRMAASRHESFARSMIGSPRGSAGKHDKRAQAMRALIQKIIASVSAGVAISC